MALKLFNTLSRSVETFVPLDPEGRKVGMYCCGPTVYDYGHIGNFRTFVFADLVRRHLSFSGYEVLHVMNITDVEDKIIRGMQKVNLPLRDYVSKYEQAFLQDMDTLGCARPHQMPRATEHIAEIIALIEALLRERFAYRAADGSVYFSIEKYQAAGRKYGQLLNLNLDQLRPGTRVQSDDYSKESIPDFALWKARVPEDGPVAWPSPWGDGRPGWHVECSAMSMKYLGPSFDLHLGGEDLIFPHHEDEIAQSEGAGGQLPNRRFVQCWLHGAHLMVEGEKMAKSLGNFFTLHDLAAKGYQGREIRFLLLKGHYRETFNFTLSGLEEARSALARLDECVTKLEELSGALVAAPDPELRQKVSEGLDDDLNVSAAWGAVFDWVREMNRRMAASDLRPEQAAAGLAAWRGIDTVFGVGQKGAGEAPSELLELLQAREAARRAKDFKRADAMRDEIRKRGWAIEDTPKGARLKKSAEAPAAR